MKNRFSYLFAGAALAALSAVPVRAGLLTAQGVFVKDIGGTERTTFSNTEKIALQQIVFNTVAFSDRIRFKFFIDDPNGAQVFSHAGNAAPPRVGNAGSQVAGVEISRFYTGPGIYTFKAQAISDVGLIEQTKTFTVSSPNIILIYPPNGAQNVTDKPLVFRWSSSGAVRYRLTVGDNPSFFNSVFAEKTGGGEDFFNYPENPADQRQRLASGQLYYWKIEGLDANDNVIAASPVPFSFSVSAASLTRDMTVKSLTMTGQSGSDYNFRVEVENQGGTSETNITLKFSLGGIAAAGTPVALPTLKPTEKREYTFSAPIPTDQGQSLAIACIDFFDDNVPNNCKSMQITRPPGQQDDGSTFDTGRTLSKDELMQAVKQKLIEKGISVTDESLEAMKSSMSQEELQALLDQLQSGTVDVSVSGPPTGAAPPPNYIPPPVSAVSGPIAQVPDQASGGALVDKEWQGRALAMGVGPTKIVVREPREFERLWKRLSDASVPEVDFEKWMVVGVVAGSKERAMRLDIRRIGNTVRGLQVEYEVLVDQQKGAENQESAAVPYHLKVISRSGSPVEFLRRESKIGAPGGPALEDVLQDPAELATAILDILRNRGLTPGADATEALTTLLTVEELQALLKQLKSGEAESFLTGLPEDAPLPPDLVPPSVSGEGPIAQVPGEDDASSAEDRAVELAKQWRGRTLALALAPTKLVLRNKRSFKRVWKRISQDKLPEVDFSKYMVVGMIAGSAQNAIRMEIEGVRRLLRALQVRYEIVIPDSARVSTGREEQAAMVPYHLKVIRQSSRSIEFKEISSRRKR